MKRKILSLVMAAVMTVGMGAEAVSAEELQGKEGWQVTFNGESLDSSFDSSDMTQEIYGILPGDSIELEVGIGNSGDSVTDWYMTNEVLQSLEDTKSVAEGGAYTYELTYIGPDGQEQVLYSSETVGGESGSEAEGLHQASESLEDYFYLGRLENDEKGSVRLRVALDGETQGNDYQDTLARLQMNFAAEEVEANVVEEKGEDNVINKVVKKVVTTAPKTGDPTQVIGYCAAALAAGIVLLILAAATMKKRRNDRKGDLK